MKLLDRLFNPDDSPVSVGSALVYERPTWRVSCVLKRQEVFGQVSTEARYEVAALTEEEARKSVRTYVLQTQPDCTIELLQVTRR